MPTLTYEVVSKELVEATDQMTYYCNTHIDVDCGSS